MEHISIWLALYLTGAMFTLLTDCLYCQVERRPLNLWLPLCAAAIWPVAIVVLLWFMVRSND